VKTIKKANTNTYEDWNLKNDIGIPVASGVYLIHVHVPAVGDAIVKAFIGMRTSDLENI
jgi:hypothetical protein